MLVRHKQLYSLPLWERQLGKHRAPDSWKQHHHKYIGADIFTCFTGETQLTAGTALMLLSWVIIVLVTMHI